MATLKAVELGVLGPLEVRQHGALVTIPGAKPRAILTMLGLHGGSVVPADAFVEVYREAKILPDQVAAWKADPTGCVIGPLLAKQHGWKIGDKIVLKAPVAGGGVETTVRAVMTYKLDNGLYVHRKYFENLTGDTGQVGMFWILAKSRADVPKITAEIEKSLSTAGARPNPHWLPPLLVQGCQVYCGFDADPTGDAMAQAMIALHPRVQRLRPSQHDWNDVLKARL